MEEQDEEGDERVEQDEEGEEQEEQNGGGKKRENGIRRAKGAPASPAYA